MKLIYEQNMFMFDRLASMPSPHMGSAWILGIDAGTTNTKATALVVKDGSSPRHIRTLSAPTPEDVPGLITLTHRLIAHLCELFPQPPTAIGIASMAESGALLDHNRQPLTPLLRWNRAPTLNHEIDPDLHRERFVFTGVRLSRKTPWSFLQALLSADSALAHSSRHWASTADLIALSLTGTLWTDATLAGRTGLYHLPGGSSLPMPYLEAVAETGLPADVLPPVEHTCREAIVPSLHGAAVTIAGHDHAVAAWAAGMRHPGCLVSSVGTAEAVLTIAHKGIDRNAAYAQGVSLVRPISGTGEGLIAGSPSCGSLIAQWMAAHPGQELPHDVSNISPDWTEPIAPYPQGRQTPQPDPNPRCTNARGAGLEEIDGQILLDSLALHSAWMQRTVSALSQGPSHRLMLLGHGLLHNDLERRLRAHHSGLPTSLVEESQPVACGAALLAAVRTGVLSPQCTLRKRPVEALPQELCPPSERLMEFIAHATHAPTAQPGCSV